MALVLGQPVRPFGLVYVLEMLEWFCPLVWSCRQPPPPKKKKKTLALIDLTVVTGCFNGRKISGRTKIKERTEEEGERNKEKMISYLYE